MVLNFVVSISAQYLFMDGKFYMVDVASFTLKYFYGVRIRTFLLATENAHRAESIYHLCAPF